MLPVQPRDTVVLAVRSCAGEGLEQARFGAFVEASYDTGRRAFSAKAVQETLIRGSIHVALLLVRERAWQFLRGTVAGERAWGHPDTSWQAGGYQGSGCKLFTSSAPARQVE